MLYHYYYCYYFPLHSNSVNQIEKVFNAASHKKVWDHFSKAQRKNIDAWKKQSLVCMTKCFFMQFFRLYISSFFCVHPLLVRRRIHNAFNQYILPCHFLNQLVLFCITLCYVLSACAKCLLYTAVTNTDV